MKGQVPDVAAAAEAFEWPPVPVLRSMFYDGYDVWIAELLGVSRATVTKKRKALGIPEFRQRCTKTERNEQRSVYTKKWAGLLRRGQAAPAAGDGTALAPGRPPASLDELVSEIKAYLDDEGRRPDVERLARRLGRPATEIREAFGQLVRAGTARWDAGLMTLLDHGYPVRPDTLPPATIKIPPRAPDTPVLLKPTPDPAEEVQDDMPIKVDREKDLALVKEYDDLANSGAKQLYKTLADRHGISTATYSARLSAARHRLEAHKNGHDVYGTGPMQRISFRCEACRDSGRVVGIGVYCDCEIGQRLKVSETVKPTPKCPMCSDSGVISGDSFELCSCEAGRRKAAELESEAAANRTASEPKVAISTTTPTAEQLPAIVEDLTGHAPTSEEMAELLAEPAAPGTAEGNLPPFHVTPDQETEILRSRIAELEAENAEQHTEIGTLHSEIAELSTALHERDAALDAAKVDLAAVSATVERAVVDHSGAPLLPGHKPHPGGTLFFLGVGHPDVLAGYDAADETMRRMAFEDAVAQLDQAHEIAQQKINEVEELNAKNAVLCRDLGRAEEKLQQPIYLAWDTINGVLSPLKGLIGPDVMKLGDQFVQPVTVDGHHLYNIYTLAMIGTDEIWRPVRVLTLVHDATAQQAREAAA